MRARRRRWLTVTSFAAALSVVAVSMAFAAITDNMVPTANYLKSCIDGNMGDGFCQTDNSTLTVYRESSLTATGKGNIYNTLKNSFNPTDLAVSYPSTPVYSGDAETDVVYRQGSVPSGLSGITWCNDAVSSYRCDQHYVQFASSSPSVALACHESGHAVGLTHGYNASPRLSNTDPRLACMTTPVAYSTLGSHNTYMINVTY